MTGHEIYIVGIGPGDHSMMTCEASAALERSDVIIGYSVYVDLVRDIYADKEFLTTAMRQEESRCRLCFEEAAKGRTVSLICSGDAGIYGLASLMFEIGKEYPECVLHVIPGITAACSGAAVLGAPINHDFCVISLSDQLTPWDLIEKRLRAASAGDFAIVLYNPSSRKRPKHLQRACDILLENIDTERACGYVRNIGRDGMESHVCTLGQLRDREVDMFTTVFIGNSTSEISDGKLITRRGYPEELK